jgi:predicted nucleotidyltransferase
MADAPPIAIEPRHWAIVEEILRRHVPDREVWAFGSRARDDAKPYSDLDLAIVGDTPLPLSVWGALTEAFSESDLPWRVDILDWATAAPSFRALIGRDKVVLRKPGVGLAP